MTYNILQIDSSPLGENSVTRKLSAQMVAGLREKHADATVTVRDLTANPLPHLDGTMIGAFFTPADQLSAAQTESLKTSEKMIAELMAANTIVIGVPMWNFGIPSVLKAWIDHIVRKGKTFTYGATGPEGLVPAGKKVVIVSSRGGIYSTGPMTSFDHQENYLKSVFHFIGLQDVSFVRAEGISMGPDAAKAAVELAQTHIAAAIEHAA